ARPLLVDGTYRHQTFQGDWGWDVGSGDARTFTVKPSKPGVPMNQPPTPSKDSSPSFSGTADTAEGDIQSVTIKVYTGTEATGTRSEARRAADGDGSPREAAPPELTDRHYQ